MRVSDRKHKIDLHVPNDEKNNRGYTFHRTIFASIDFNRGDQTLRDHLLTHSKVLSIMVKAIYPITEEMRISISGEMFDVLSVDPYAKRGSLSIDLGKVDE